MDSLAGVSKRSCLFPLVAEELLCSTGRLTFFSNGELSACDIFVSPDASGEVGEVVSVGGTTSLTSSAAGARGFGGSGPLAELLLVSSSLPWANRHLSPYLQLPFSLQFLHISYLRRLTTGYGAVAAVELDDVLSKLELASTPPYFACAIATPSFFSLSREELVPERDWEEGLPKLCSAKGCFSIRFSFLTVCVIGDFFLIWYEVRLFPFPPREDCY